MTSSVPRTLALAAFLLTAPFALAQTSSPGAPGSSPIPPASPGPAPLPAGSVGSTVSGGLPSRAASTTAVGRTKPPGEAAPGTRPDLDAKSRQLDRKINRGICTGC